MVLYVVPLHGCLSLSAVRRATFVRLHFLLKVLQCGRDAQSLHKFHDVVSTDSYVMDNASFLTENSSLDRVSHFLLFLICILHHETFSQAIISAEIALFRFRLRTLTPDEIRKSIGKLKRDLFIRCEENDDSEYRPVCETLATLLTCVGGSKQLAELAHSSSNANISEILVPFRAVPSLVAKREVTMRKGYAEIAPSQLHYVLEHMFAELLRMTETKIRTNRETFLRDPRINELRLDLKV